MVDKEFWRDRRVFVTGASGLLGGWMVKRLLELKADVVVLLRDWVPDSLLWDQQLFSRVKIVRGDICELDLLQRVIHEYEISSVMHLAAQTVVQIANAHPVATFESNIKGTWNLLEACRHSSLVQSVVFASSDKAYGGHPQLPYNETFPLIGRHPYDVSKSCADLIAQSYAHSFDLPVSVTRCGNFYGGGDLNWNRIVPGTIRSLFHKETPMIRSNGKFIRDYIYVKDGVEAYLLLAQKLVEKPELKGEAFNFSTELKLNVLEMVDSISKAMDIAIKPQILNQATNEIIDQHLCAKKARNVLGWQPQFSLDESMVETVRWYRDFFNERR